MESDSQNIPSHVVLTKGTMMSHYRIVEKMSAGAMGDTVIVTL